jgi:UDP-N-acetylglucosamine--dolichyl-phosphate N-acetylglucosaminephosphotransferase
MLAFFTFHLLIPRLKRVGIVGRDMNKPGGLEVPEMGGLGIIVGFASGLILAIALKTFTGILDDTKINVIQLFAVLAMVLLIGLIGIIDDLVHIRQSIKALTPLFAAMPLAAIEAGFTMMKIPFIGWVDFKLLYPLAIVPLGITVASNAVNMLAGFNGLEVGMGIVASIALAIIAYTIKNTTVVIILVSAIGAMSAAMIFNWYPAKIFIGDVGTLSIGAVIAASVCIGNYETAGVFIIIPYFIDFILKALHRFPSKGWWGKYNNGKLYCPESGPVGLCQLVMKLTGGISEKGLVLILIGFEALCGLLAVLMLAKF